MEDQIELICKFRWPAHGPGSFRSERTIGRDTRHDSREVFQMPGFHISLLRDTDAFERFCSDHMTELRTRIRDPWEFWVEVVPDDDLRMLRRFLPEKFHNPKFGPFPAD